MVEYDKIKSSSDNLEIEIAYTMPKGEVCGIVQISHGMSEHKERYFDFMEFLSDNGYVCVINDHRGHGNSVKKKEDLGYFYTEDISYIVNDLHDVTKYIKDKFNGKEVFLFSHSMGTLVARNYIQNYDDEISKLVLCGAPTKNPFTNIGIVCAYFFKSIGQGKKANKVLNKLTFSSYNKKYKKENEWLSKNPNNVSLYNNDELCGFVFTTNGFINLYKLLKNAFKKELYKIKNKNLPILLIAGEEDPVIQSKEHYEKLQYFLNDIGYDKTEMILYKELRHEILNEEEYEKVYRDVLNFFRK